MGKKSKEKVEVKKKSKRDRQKKQSEKQSRDKKLKTKSRGHKKTRNRQGSKKVGKKNTHHKSKTARKKNQKTKKKSNKKMEIFLSGILVFLICLTAFVIFLLFHYTKGEVISGSMEPTLGVNDRVVIDKKKEAKRFDMIVFYPPDNKKEKWVKRIIGLPGEKIDYFDDHLYVNSKEVKEPFLEEGKKKTKKKPYTNDFDLSQIPGMKPGEDKIPKDCYLVMGDNRQNSEDSRVIGLVKKDQIEGVVLFRYAPLSKFGSVYDSSK